jgi:phytoene synthase
MWNATLDAAGIRSRQLRDDFTRQRKLVARYKPHAYVAARLLLPRPLTPHVIASIAFMHHTDNLLDSGPRNERAAAYALWEKEVREALATGHSSHPVIRPLLHTIAAHPRLRQHIEDFLATATTDLDFTGFATEADYQHYIDRYSLPAFMLIACLLAPVADPDEYRSACRTYIDGSQRLDFANDLAEDLLDGRLAIPRDTLRDHGVSRDDLEQARNTPQVRALLRHVLAQAHRTLTASRPVTELIPPANRPLVRSMIDLEQRTAAAAAAKGSDLLSGSARPSVPAALIVLGREYVRSRRSRGASR